MSGGLDSTSIAAVACKIARKNGASGPLRAYTIDCRPMFNDQEGILASLVAENLGMDIEILSGAYCLPYEGWEDSLRRTPEPFHDPFLLLSQRQYRQVQSHSRVVLSGYGGDDILNSQAWPYLTYLFRRRDFGNIVKTFGRYILKHGRIPRCGEVFAPIAAVDGPYEPADGISTVAGFKLRPAARSSRQMAGTSGVTQDRSSVASHWFGRSLQQILVERVRE